MPDPRGNILIVEDNPALAENIADYLEAKGYIVDVALDGFQGFQLAMSDAYDCLVLDLMLPGIDGITLCQRLRQEVRSSVPIIMLTARDTLEDKSAGFGVGADDYLVKPFELRELDLRLQALIRRARPSGFQRQLCVADLVYDLETRTVRRAGTPIVLAATALKLLERLMQRSPGVVSRRDLERAAWGDEPPESDALRVHMHSLRVALDLPGTVPLLFTVRGVGYQLRGGD